MKKKIYIVGLSVVAIIAAALCFQGVASSISSEEMQKIATNLEQPAAEKCIRCGGSGRCVVCHGKGYTTIVGPGKPIKRTCNNCNGTGKCPRCKGTGVEK